MSACICIELGESCCYLDYVAVLGYLLIYVTVIITEHTVVAQKNMYYKHVSPINFFLLEAPR